MRKEAMQMDARKKEDENMTKLGSGGTPVPSSFFKLFDYADWVDWLLMALGTLGAIVHGLAQPTGYLLLGKALDAFGSNINDNKAMVKALYKVVPYVFYMAIATLPAGILEVGCWMYAGQRQVARLRLAYLASVLKQEIGAFDTDLSTGRIMTGVTNHMNLIQDAIGEKMGHFTSSLSAFFGGIMIAFICCWEVALLTVVVVPLILAIGATYTGKLNGVSALRVKYLSELTSLVEETISQIKTVFSFAGESSSITSFSLQMEKQLRLGRAEAVIKGVGIGTFQTVTFCSWALIVWIGAIVVTAKRSSGGDTLAAVMSILFGAISFTYAAPDLQVFNQAKAAGAEVFTVLERKSSISYDTPGELLGKIDGSISIEGVRFSYPSRMDKEVLRGFSLHIPAGKVVALVGSSGCGKSTILALLQRFYDPSGGDIFIDGCNIKDLDLRFLRSNIGVVSQEPSLFTGTINDNLKIGNSNASNEMIEKAATTANIHSFISELPDRYATEVGERGVQLSGGQKQRIAIARAVLKNPPILLLDEATSALDSESEKLVQAALEKAMQRRTVILIAHRMSTIVNADIIVVVDNGKVLETGTHGELLETSKLYNMLYTMQDLSSGAKLREMDPKGKQISYEPIITKSWELTSEQSRDMSEMSVELSMDVQKKTTEKTFALFLRLWFGLNKLEIWKSILGSIAAAFSGISKPVFGFFIMTIGVAYYKDNARTRVGWYAIAFCAIGLLTLGTHTLQHYFYGVIGERAMRNFREALYAAVLRNEIAWFERPENNVGYLTSRIVNDTSMIKTIISDRMSVIVQCISSILIATVVSMAVNWRMGLVAWAVMPCHFIGGLIQAKSAQGFSADSSVSHQRLVSLTTEAATNIKTVASFCHEEDILKKAEWSLEVPTKKGRRESVKYGIVQGVSLCLWNIAHAVALWYTTILVSKKQATFENGIRSYQIFSLTVPSITELWTLIPTVISAICVLTPAFETLDRKSEIQPDVPKVSQMSRIDGKVEFRKIVFSYPSRPEVTILNKFNLVIEAGLKVALVGPSGAGKSSVLTLLLRFYDPFRGKILIDKKDIKDCNLRWLRSQIGLVQQEPLLFSSTIRDNICYGSEGGSEAEMLQVSMAVNVHDFVSSLPDGYDTVVGEKGCQLSGGQKQRIAIARTLLKKPSILLLDEATSALDTQSESIVIDALNSMKAANHPLSGSTQIMIAHRLSTVRNCDSIVVMDKGKVVEMGQHSELVLRDGIYSKLCKLQSMNDHE